LSKIRVVCPRERTGSEKSSGRHKSKQKQQTVGKEENLSSRVAILSDPNVHFSTKSHKAYKVWHIEGKSNSTKCVPENDLTEAPDRL
jgi:hypothetical protein